MKTTNRFRRAGLLTVAALSTLAISACQDGFFFDPAPAGLTPISVQYAYVSGVDGMALAGAGEAFDKADGARVVLTSADQQLFNERVTLEASGADKKLTFSVELPTGSAITAGLQVTLLQGEAELFAGSATTAITPGQAAEVTVPVTGVVDAVALNSDAVTLRILGGMFRLSTTGLFASGDTLGPVSATYRALGSAVSVAGDGTITAVSNGVADVEASYLGKTATVTVTVDDRCVPGPLPAIGTTFVGTLDDLDCPISETDNRVAEWYDFEVDDPVTVKFSMESGDFVPRWFLYEETGPGRYPDFDGFGRAHQLDDSVGFEAVALPSGKYRISIYAAPSLAAPRGSYTFSSEIITDDNDFLCPIDNGKGTLWITPGYSGEQDFGGGCTDNTGGGGNQDRFGLYLEPGVEYIIRTSAPGGYSPEMFLFYTDPEPVSSASGGDHVAYEINYTVPLDNPGWHGLTVAAAPGETVGPYYLSFEEASKDAGACPATPIDILGTQSGTLDWRTPCYFLGLYASEYFSFTLTEETTILGEMTASLPTNWGIIEASGPLEDRFRYATGGNVGPAMVTLPAGDYNLFVSALSENLGPWSLTFGAVSANLDVGCNTRVHIVPGFFGTQSLNNACTTSDGRNQDRYRVRLTGGQSYSMNVVSTDVITEVSVFGPGGTVLAVDEIASATSGPDEVVGPALSNLVTFTAPETNWYTLVVTASTPGDTGIYVFEFNAGAASATGTLSGSVTAGGSPLAGVTVSLAGPVSLTVLTDASGNYAFTGLPLGGYSVAITGGVPGNVVMDALSGGVLFDAPNQTKQLDFTGTVLTAGTVEGSVIADAAGLPGVVVTAVGPGGTFTTTTDALGAYSIAGLVAGSYSVAVSGPVIDAHIFPTTSQIVSVTPGLTTSADFSGSREKGVFSMSVTVVVSSDPNGHEASIEQTTTTFFEVEITSTGDIIISSFESGTRWVAVSGTPNPDGSFNLTGNGTVAGFPNIDVLFDGTLTFSGGIVTGVTGTYTMGPGTQLPADGLGNHNPAIYTVTGTRLP